MIYAMKKMVDLNDLMEEQLRDMFDSEKAFSKLLKKVQAKATDEQLKEIVKNYLEENEGQLLRLRRVFDILYKQKRGEKCDAIEAMIREAKDIISRSMDATVMDAGIITALQHIIHYQIAGYGAICNYANTLGHYNVAGLMHQNLEEEKRIDRKLAMLAEGSINIKAKGVSY
jgi:ferritin-like metal-binding protein YciE